MRSKPDTASSKSLRLLFMMMPKSNTVPLAVSEVLARVKASRGLVVSTNGCFDLLHIGHIRFLKQCREMGDCLIMGLNSDASIRTLKGVGRPVVPENERVEILMSLSCVDAVVLFDDLTPVKFIEAIRPDIHVKGEDYAPDNGRVVPEAEVVAALGGEMRYLPLLAGHSTTRLIRSILASCDSECS